MKTDVAQITKINIDKLLYKTNISRTNQVITGTHVYTLNLQSVACYIPPPIPVTSNTHWIGVQMYSQWTVKLRLKHFAQRFSICP